MKELLIIGARGFGRDIYNLALICSDYNKDYIVKGFLDDKINALESFNNYPPIIDSVENYNIKENDVFICALGDVQFKKKYIKIIKDKGGRFISLIHPAAWVDSSAKVGAGCIILQNAVLGSGSIIGDFVLIQISTIVGHDVKVGDYSRVDCHAVCTGGSVLEEEVTIHTAAIINQKVRVGRGACVGAGSFVIRKVIENTTVYGNPAIRLK